LSAGCCTAAGPSGGDHGRLTLTWRGKPKDIETLGAVMGEIPDTTLESWEVEE
jgi:hypothetical protein